MSEKAKKKPEALTLRQHNDRWLWYWQSKYGRPRLRKNSLSRLAQLAHDGDYESQFLVAMMLAEGPGAIDGKTRQLFAEYDRRAVREGMEAGRKSRAVRTKATAA